MGHAEVPWRRRAGQAGMSWRGWAAPLPGRRQGAVGGGAAVRLLLAAVTATVVAARELAQLAIITNASQQCSGGPTFACMGVMMGTADE